jgi:hypothetical protein
LRVFAGFVALDAATAARLLHDMGQFMRQQMAPGQVGGGKCALPEHDGLASV